MNIDYKNRTTDVFISYSSKETEIADKVHDVFESRGITCWMAPDSIPPGTQYADVISYGIKNCRVFVIILSQLSMVFLISISQMFPYSLR